jgi:uroporphyrinogen III methyltransferase/synthase
MSVQGNQNTILKQGTSPLLGKTVVITRPKDQAEEFAGLLRERGASTLFIPTIEIAPPESWERCDDAIHNISRYYGVIFTSVNAVRYFMRRVDNSTSDASDVIRQKTLYAVGSKTAEAILAAGLTPTTYPGIENGIDLANAIVASPVEGKRLLFPKGNLAGEEITEILRGAKATVDEVIVYQTIAPRDADAQSIREQLEDGSIDVIAFFSPSSVKNFVQLVSRELIVPRTLAVIGTSTLAAVREAGMDAQIVSDRPTSADLVEAIVRHYNQ